MRARITAAFALAVIALSAAGCNGITTPSNNVSDPFSGTLEPGTQKSHAFSVSKTGEFTVKLTSWGPNTNLLVGLAWTVGNNDGTCTTSILQQNNFVALNAQALGGQIVSGRYCIFIFDVGTLTAAQTYTITVSHP
jgi:hypothetical protein